MSRYRPPTNLPTAPAQLAAVLLEHLRKISEDLSTIPSDDVNTVVVQERVDVPAGSTRRISPPTTGGIAILEAPGPNNTGKKAVIIIENPAGSLKVVASPHRSADGKITASTINDASQATYTLPGVVTFTSNGVDSWKTQAEVPAESTALVTSVTGDNTIEFKIDDISKGDISSLNIVGAHASVTGLGGKIDLHTDTVTQSVGGTVNAHVLPVALVHRDTLVWTLTSNVTLNGIDTQDADGNEWPEGFEFFLRNNATSLTVTINDESGSAVSADRISTPRDQQIVLGPTSCVFFRRYTAKWIVVERGWPEGSTSITYSGVELRRAALTGFAAASANSNATTSAEPIVTYSSSSNMSAERVTTSSTSITVSTSVASQIEFQRAALTGAITASANANATLFDTNASGAGLTGGGTAVLAVGAGTGITVNANDVAVTNPMPAVGPIGSQLVSFGSFASPMWCHVMTEQFLGPIGDARFIGNSWIWNTSGSMNLSDITAVASHPGIRRFTRLAASGSGTSMAYVGDSSTDPAISIADVAFLYFVVRAPTVATNQTSLTDKRLVIGLVADASDASNFGGDGLALILDLDGATTWRIKDENSSSATFTTTVTATIDGWVECLLINEGSGTWGVFVNGTDYGTHAGVITSGTLVPAVICNATAAVGAVLDVDEFTIGFLSAANRYG